MFGKKELQVEDVQSIGIPNINSPDLVFVPEKRVEVIAYRNTIHTVIKLFRSRGIKYEVPNIDEAKYLELRSADIFLPAIFISLQMYADKKDILDLIFEVLSNYIDSAKSKLLNSAEPNVDFSVYTSESKTKKVKRISYKGPSSGLSELKETIEGILNDKN